jgi:hypothetical protein
MLNQTLSLGLRRATPIALLALLTASVAAAAWQTLDWSDADHKKMGRALNKFFGEKTSEKEREKARAELLADLEKFGKKRGLKDPEEAVQAALASHADLGKALSYSGDAKNVRGGKAAAMKVEFGGESFEYALQLPATYKPSGPALPLVLCIPGMREGKPLAPMTFLQDDLQDPALREGAVLAAIGMPEDDLLWTVLNSDGRPGGLFAAMAVFRDVSSSVTIDYDRVYVVGREQGVPAAMVLGAKYPHLFAGIAGLAGDIGEIAATNFCNLPTFLQGGANGTKFEEQSKQLAYGNCTIKPDATVADLWSWIGQTTRVANPAKVVLAPEPLKVYKAYWVGFAPIEGLQSTVTATADRATNTIKIDSEEVRSMTLYLNDAIADLSKPITFVLNGRNQQQKVARSLDDMLALISRGTSDPGRLFVAQITLDIPR